MENKQPNDIFVALLQKSDASVFDLAASDMVPANTQLLPMEDYKQSDVVQQMFKTPSGDFNEDAFNQTYKRAAELYNTLDTDKTLASALEYDPFDFTAPKGSKKIDVRPTAMKDVNPFKQLYSRTGVNTVDTNNLSLRELAQQSKIFDVKTNKWLDKSANEMGFFGSLFSPTLVYAQWDEDGKSFDPITNKMTEHKKGDWKFDENGNLYIETLGDREIHGKQIVNPTDLLTKEGSTLNKIDFFDSDGKEKSAVGTTFKIASEIAPFLIPGFNIFYGGLKMAIGLSSVLPTFYKAGEGIFLGDNEDGVETDLWKAMNATEGFMAKFTDRSTSDAAQQSMWNYEQLSGMVSDVFAQIYEQRAAASLSKLFYRSSEADYLKKLSSKTEEIMTKAAYSGFIGSKKEAEDIAKSAMLKSVAKNAEDSSRSKLAKALNLGYMAMTQSADVYAEAIDAGYDRRVAGFTALLAAGGQYALMSNNPMGDWFLDKTVGYSEGTNKAAIRKLVNTELKDVQEAMKNFDIDQEVGKRQLGGIFKRFKNKVDNFILMPLSESSVAEELGKRAVVEGLEEVSEQAAIDAAKGIVDTFSYLGLTGKQGSFGGFSNVFSKAGLENYIANFVGGMIGGPMFELERSVISPLIQTGKLPTKTELELYDFVSNGKTKELLEAVDSNKHRFGSTTLSPIATVIGGDNIYLPTKDISQADIIANQVKERIKQIDKIVNLENLGQTDEELIKKSIMDQIYIKDLKKSGVDRFVLSDAKQLGMEIVSLNTEITALEKSKTDENKDEVSNKISELTSKLKEKREEFTELVSGTKSEYYHGLSLFTLNPALHTPFISLNVDEYVKKKYDKDFYSLSEQDKEQMRNEFDTLMSTSESNLKNRMKLMYDSFLEMNESFSKSIKDYDADGYASVRSRFYNILHNVMDGSEESMGGKVPIYVALQRLNEVNRSLRESGFSTHTLDSQTDISVGQFLVESGFIEETLNQEEIANLSVKHASELAKKLGFEQESGEEDSAFVSRIKTNLETALVFKESSNRVLARIEEEFPNFKDMTIKELVVNMEESNKFSDEEKSLVYAQFPEYSEIYNLAVAYDIIENKVLNGEQIEDSDLASLGLNVPEGTEDSEKLEMFKNKGLDIKNQLKEIENKKVSIGFDVEFDKSLSNYKTEISQGRELSEENKELAVRVLDSIGMPSTEFNLNVLQEQLNQINPNGQYNFRVKSIDKFGEKVLNPRRALLLKYAEGVIADGAALDSEIVSELVKEKDLIENFIDGQDEFDPVIEEAINQLERLKAILSNSNRKINSLYDKLREFETELYGWAGPVSIFTIMKENVDKFNEIMNASEFKRTDVQLAQIDKALHVLGAVKAVVAAMSSTELGADNLYGMNVSLNKALEKEGETPKYETISSEASVVTIKDLNLIESKLRYLKKLAENNSATIVENQARIQKSLIDGIAKQSMDKSFNLSLVNLKFNGKSVFTSDDIEKINAIQDPELKLIEIEHRFYTNFHKEPGSVKEKLDSLFSSFILNGDREGFAESIIESRDSNLVEDFSRLEIGDWYKYVHFILANTSHNFYKDYENNIKNELSLQEQKSPFYTQQFAIRQALGYFENKQIISHIVDFIQEDIEKSLNLPSDLPVEEKASKIREVIAKANSFPINNIMAVRGSGGTGKSSVIANWVLRMIIDQKKLGDTIEIIAVAPTQETLDVLSKDIKGNISLDINKQVKDQFLKNILTAEGYSLLEKAKESIEKVERPKLNDLSVDGHLDPKYFVLGEGSGAILLTQDFFNDFVIVPAEDASPRVVVIDEMSKINTLEWQILNHISRKDTSGKRTYDNYYILTLGDEIQNGVNIGVENFGMDNIFVPGTVKLKNPIRSKNVHQNDNNITLENFANEWKHAQSSGKLHSNSIILNYSEKDGEYLAGSKMVNELTEKDLKKLDPNKQIAVITEDGTLDDDTKKMFESVFGSKKIEVYPPEVQGREFDQVVILANIKKKYKYLEARNLYTLLSRAKEATIFLNTTSFEVENNKMLYNSTFDIDPNIIKQSLIDRSKVIEELNSHYERENIKSDDNSIKPIDKSAIKNDPINLNENQDDTALTFEDKDSTKEPLKDNQSLAYSFFNNIGLSGDDYIKYLDYTISDKTDDSNKKITWKDLLNKLNKSITGTDLFSIPYVYFSDRRLVDIINEFVRFKNNLLFSIVDNVPVPDQLFQTDYTSDKALVLKRLNSLETKNGTTKLDNPIYSYGELVSLGRSESPVYAIGKYITINGKKTFITLAVTPDINNPKIPAVIVGQLRTVYDEVDKVSEGEIDINPDSIKVYKGIQVPRNAEGSSAIQPIAVDDIETLIPGASVSEIRVFRDDVQYIRDQFKQYETSEVVDEKRDFSKYRFRPYVIVSFTDGGGNKFSKLVVLQGKSRNLTTFWSELVKSQIEQESHLNDSSEKDPEMDTVIDVNPKKTAHLISKYRGWEVIYEFFKSLDGATTRKEMAEWINNLFMFEHQGKAITWEPFTKVINAFASVDPNSPLSFREFLEANDDAVKKLVIDAKDTQHLKIGNPIFLLYKLSLAPDSEFGVQLNKFLEEKGDKLNIYYNTIIQSVNVFGEGQQYGLLYENDDPEKNQRKYYTMNYAVEPNKLLFDLDKIMDTSSKQKTPTKETVVIVPENNKALKSLEVEVEGTKHTITISQNAEDNPNILINTSSVKESNKNIIVELMHKFAVYSVASEEWEYDEDSGEIVKYDNNGNPLSINKYLSNIYNSVNYLEIDDNGKPSFTPTVSSGIRDRSSINTQTTCNLY